MPSAITALVLALRIVDHSYAAPPSSVATEINATAPPFVATVNTDFDIIRTTDPSAFACHIYAGRTEQQIWDKRVDDEPLILAYSFTVHFNDGTEIEIAVNPEFGSEQAARNEAMRYTTALGQLPGSLRAGIRRLGVHAGDESPHGGAGNVIIYAETATQRMGYDHLEETIFHEAVHAAWDEDHRLAPDWVAAQKADGGFLTAYGASIPDREDLPETALFAYALQHYPGRIPPADTDAIRNAVPHRLAYIDRILSTVPPVADLYDPSICQQ
jgi:hypothetical protein